MRLIRKYYNHTPQTNPQHREEESQNIYSNKTSVRQQKQRNQLSLSLQDDRKTRQDTKLCTTKQRQTQNPHNQWEAHQTADQQEQNHRLSTETSLSHRGGGGGGGLKCILLVPNISPRSCCCYNTKLLRSHGNLLTNIRTYSTSSQRNNQIKLTHCDETKKMAHDSQIVRAKRNLKLSYGGPSQGQASGTDQRIKALRQGHR